MNIIWGLIIAAVGALFVTWCRTKSNFGPADNSSPTTNLRSDRLHGFHQVAAASMITTSAAIALTRRPTKRPWSGIDQ